MKTVCGFLGVMGTVVLLAGLTGCRSVPVTGRTQLLLTSESYENDLGEQGFSEYKQKLPRTANSEQIQAVNRVGTALLQVVEQTHKTGWKWELTVFQDNTANAFCMPGGKIAVYSGLFKYMKNDAELACVMAHEIAHALARHSGERISWSELQSLGFLALSKSAQDGLWGDLYGLGTNLGVMLPFSRSNEREADAIGVKLMAQSGYNPQASISFWNRFSEGKASSGLDTWFSTHPSDAERIANLKTLMPEALADYKKSKIKHGDGVTFSGSR